MRQRINSHIRERLARDGKIHGPAFNGGRLVSHGYTNAEKALTANYSPGDVVAFHRPYKRLGVAKGDELAVAGADHEKGAVMLEGKDGASVVWKPGEVAGRSGGVEVYRTEGIPASNPRGPPLSVVLTDWLSITPAVAAAARPSASRVHARSARLTSCHVPSSRHL